jgi:cell division protein FtsN
VSADSTRDTATKASALQAARPKAPPQARDTKPSIVDASKLPKPTASKLPAPILPRKTATPAGNGYSVQVAAYARKADAEKLAVSLRNRGYQARVDGEVAPFRVRIGRYVNEGQAEDALRKIKAKKMEGFVVRAPGR